MFDRAYAKINLSLDVFNRRADGYHELRSIMLPLNFYDELQIEKAEQMSYECNVPYLTFDESNTIVKAITLFKQYYGIADNYKVILNKLIPSQAGLAGGSADGAAALRILFRMYGIKPKKEEIKELCLKIGADVIFTYYNRPALVSGIGEELAFFSIKTPLYVLLVKPSRGISTKEAYGSLDLSLCDHPDVEKLKERLINGEDFFDLLGNSLEEPSLRLCRAIRKVKEELLALGANCPLMSGSGSTVFVISKDREEILYLYHKMNKGHYFVRYTEVRI